MDLYIFVSVQEFIGLTYKGLREFEAQHCGIEPIEIRASIFCLLNQSVEKLILSPIFVTENEFLNSLVQYQLSLHLFHKGQPKPSAKQCSRKRYEQLSLLIGLNAVF